MKVRSSNEQCNVAAFAERLGISKCSSAWYRESPFSLHGESCRSNVFHALMDILFEKKISLCGAADRPARRLKKTTLQEHPRWHRASSVALLCYSLTSSPTCGVDARRSDAALASLVKAASPWLLCVVARV